MLSRCVKMIVIWVKPDGTIYHKFVSGHYCDYFVGYCNNYGHRVIYLINDLYYKTTKPPFKQRFKRKLIHYINNM